jgi:DNA-binding protein HU-beta
MAKTKAELIEMVQQGSDSDLSKKAIGEIVDATFEALAASIREEGRFAYPGFGTFTVKERAEREGRNPKTRETITIAASKSVGFKPASKFKDSL